MQNFNLFDFLRETVSKVPELGGSEIASEDRSTSTIKRRFFFLWRKILNSHLYLRGM